MTDLYSDTTEDIVTTYRRIHANSEQTHVAIITAGNDDYVVIAYDVDPRDYNPVKGELIAYDPTLEGAVERAERWMDTHPKGILGDDSSGGGFMAKLMGVLRTVNEYGNKMAQQHQHHHEQQEDPETPK